ncbi:hypothetical protein GCM10028796_29430 [Ramlibacter monticola]
MPGILLHRRGEATFGAARTVEGGQTQERQGLASQSQENLSPAILSRGICRRDDCKSAVSHGGRILRLVNNSGGSGGRDGPPCPAGMSFASTLGAFFQSRNLEILKMKLIAGGLLVLATMGVASTAMAADGKTVYETTCAMCHAAGVAGAPKFGDKAAWAPRIATGKAALVASVVKGKNAMPPKGGKADLTDADIAAAVDYITAAAK